MDLNQWKKLFASTEQATGYTPAQIRKNSGQSGGLTRSDDSAFKLEAEKLEAIRQQNSKGFQIFDLNPNNIEREDAFCAYSGDVLQTIVGTESVNSISAAGAGDLYYDNSTGVFSNGTAVVAPYWRSIYIPVAGNFLKVEYLPSRIGVDTGDFNTNPFSNQRIQNSTEPQNTTEKDFYDFYAPFSPTYFNANKVSSDRIILLDFNEPTDKPIIVKHGERVKNYFNGIWVTFKQSSPRIRITIGFNSEISTVEDRPSSLHLWRGHGLMNDSFINPIPFSLSDYDMPPGEGGDGTGIQFVNPGTSIIEKCLVANPSAVASFQQNGLSVLWITNLSFVTNFTTSASQSEDLVTTLSLYIKSLGTFFSRYVTGSVKIKRLYNGTVIRTLQGNLEKVEVSFDEPIRVCLRRETGLFLRLHQNTQGTGSNIVTCRFSIAGYCYGPLQNLLLSGESVPRIPFTTRYKLGEHPYPTDEDNLYSPLS